MAMGLKNANCVNAPTKAVPIPNDNNTTGPKQQSDATMPESSEATNDPLIIFEFLLIITSTFEKLNDRTFIFFRYFFTGKNHRIQRFFQFLQFLNF